MARPLVVGVILDARWCCALWLYVFGYHAIMVTNTIIDPTRVLTARGHDLGNYRFGLARYGPEKWGRIITALDAGRTILVAPVDGSDTFDLAVTDDAEFCVLPVTSDGV